MFSISNLFNIFSTSLTYKMLILSKNPISKYIDGSFNIPGTMPIHASQVYAKNVSALVNYMCPEGKLEFDLSDEIVFGSMFTHNGEIIDERTADALKGE